MRAYQQDLAYIHEDDAGPSPRQILAASHRRGGGRRVTSFQDAGSSLETIDVFRQMALRKKLQVRLWVMLRDSNRRLARDLAACRMVGAGDNHLTVRDQAFDRWGAGRPRGLALGSLRRSSSIPWPASMPA